MESERLNVGSSSQFQKVTAPAEICPHKDRYRTWAEFLNSFCPLLTSTTTCIRSRLGLDVYLSNDIVLLYRPTSRKAFAPDMRPLALLSPLIEQGSSSPYCHLDYLRISFRYFPRLLQYNH